MSEQNNIPKHWQVKKLKSISDSIQYGYTESSSQEKIGPRFLRITDIQDNKVIWNNVPYCKIDEDIKAKYLLKDGDLVFARTGATVGKSFLIKGNIPESVFASYLIRVRVNKEIDDKYLYCFFQSPNYWNQITEGQVGIGQPNVNGTKLGQLDIPIPPLPEQLAIVSKIEELLSDLENGKQQLLTAQQQLKVYRQSLLKAAFEGRLTNKEVKDGELPEGWKWVKLGDFISRIEAGKSFKCDERPPHTNEVGVLKVSAVTWGVYNEQESKTIIEKERYNEAYIVKDGDFLFSRANTLDLIGAAVVVGKASKQLMLSDKTLRFIFNNQIDKYYALYYLRSKKGRHEIQRLSTGNQESMRNIGQARINQIEIPIPPNLKEQQQIVEILESKLTVCDKIEETIAQSLQQAETLKQSILKKAFEGRLVP